jgi:hypothetical protein
MVEVVVGLSAQTAVASQVFSQAPQRLATQLQSLEVVVVRVLTAEEMAAVEAIQLAQIQVQALRQVEHRQGVASVHMEQVHSFKVLTVMAQEVVAAAGSAAALHQEAAPDQVVEAAAVITARR